MVKELERFRRSLPAARRSHRSLFRAGNEASRKAKSEMNKATASFGLRPRGVSDWPAAAPPTDGLNRADSACDMDFTSRRMRKARRCLSLRGGTRPVKSPRPAARGVCVFFLVVFLLAPTGATANSQGRD